MLLGLRKVEDILHNLLLASGKVRRGKRVHGLVVVNADVVEEGSQLRDGCDRANASQKRPSLLGSVLLMFIRRLEVC